MVRKNGDEEAAEEAEYDAIILSKQAVVPEKTGMIQTGGSPPEDELLLLISFTMLEGEHDMDMVMSDAHNTVRMKQRRGDILGSTSPDQMGRGGSKWALGFG